MSSLDYNWIVHGRLAQGGLHTKQNALRLAPEIFKNFHMLVLCAEEIQPRIQPPEGRRVVRLPFDDDIYQPIPHEVSAIFHTSAKTLAAHLRQDCRMLVTCAQGRNRSGLINALVLMYAFGMPAREAIATIRNKRSRDSLANPMFEQYLLNTRVR